MYPLPATSMAATPGIGPISSASSAAIFFGACRNCFASWKAAGHGHLAELALPRLLDRYRQVDAVANLYVRVESARNLLFNGMEHGNYEYNVAALRSRIPEPSWCVRN